MAIAPALGVNLKDYDLSLLEGKNWRISEKVDGVRRLFHKDFYGNVTCWARSGLEDTQLQHICEYLDHPWYPRDTVYDCEIVDRESYLSKIDSYLMRTKTVAKCNQQHDTYKKDLIAVCFDIFHHGDAHNGWERNTELIKCFGDNPLIAPVIKVPIYGIMKGADIDLINYTMNQVKLLNGEGIMLMDLDEMYVAGRSKTLVKVKRMEEFLGRIVDIELARDDTKIKGGIAALICQVDGCTTPVRVGTGFTNKLRYDLAKMDLIGRVIEIDAFSQTQDIHGNSSLSMPVFKGFYDRKE